MLPLVCRKVARLLQQLHRLQHKPSELLLLLPTPK